MDVHLRAAPISAKPVIARLLEFNAYELSAVTGADLDDDGRYGYPYLDAYWDGSPGRAPYLITVDGHLAGFALARPGPPHEVAEFLVLPRYRRTGVGQAAARQLFASWPGRWVVHELSGNDRAVAFWRRAIPRPFTETIDATGTTQHFTEPAPPLTIMD